MCGSWERIAFRSLFRWSSEYSWHPDIGNKKIYFDFISQWLPRPVHKYSDWLVHSDLFRQAGGGIFLDRYKTFLKIYPKYFPEFYWDFIWKFPTFSEFHKKRLFIDHCFSSHFTFIKTHKDTLAVEWLLCHPRGRAILEHYGYCPAAVFREIYPEMVPTMRRNYDGYWKERVNVDKFIVENMGFIENHADFDEISTSYISAYPGGSTLLTSSNGSYRELFGLVYPELNSPFGKNVRHEYWKNLNLNNDLQKNMICYGINKKEDWYRLSIGQIAIASGRIISLENVIKLLEFYHPEEEWDYLKMTEKKKRSRQRLLGEKLTQIFGDDEVMFEEYTYKFQDRTFVFDFYIPGMKLVFEYQGEHHYYDVQHWSSETQKKRDTDKRSACTQAGFTLICIPYWWDNTTSTLHNIIQSQAPTTITITTSV